MGACAALAAPVCGNVGSDKGTEPIPSPVLSSSLYPTRNSGGTCSATDVAPFPAVPVSPPISSHLLLSSSNTSSLVFPSAVAPSAAAHSLHLQLILLLAKSLLVSSLHSSPPTWPSTGISINARMATSAVRIPHAGCHVSSWCPEMLRQISRLTSKRPDGVRKRKEGGRSGYWAGREMRP